MDFNLLRTIVGGAWHVNIETYLNYAPIRDMILKHGLQFPTTTDNSSLPYFLAAQGYDRFEVITDKTKGDFIAVTVISGVLTQADQACGQIGTTTMAANIEHYDNQRNVIGHILFIDSGGGQTISLDPFKEIMPNLTKPVVAFVKNMAASAAYGIASFAQEIYASKPDAVVGSIGTMISFDGYPANAESPDGIRHVRLYASKSTKKNAAFEEALSGNYKPLVESMLNPTNEAFINMIQSNRKKVTDDFTDGADYPASEVVGTLVDGIQSFEATINRVIELSKKSPKSNSLKKSNNTNSSNSINMGNRQKILMLAALSAIFGGAIEVDSEGYIAISQDQAKEIDAAMASIATIKSALKDATEARAIADAALATANATIAERDATITAQAEQIATLSKEPGAKPSKVIASSDPTSSDPTGAFASGSFEDMASIFKI